MNLTQPPFDDIHVRRAMNWIMDKTSLRQVWGGPDLGKIANHIVPDSIFDNQLSEFAPYKTPGDAGDLAKAKAAMKGSKYDIDGNGTCSAPACKNVLLLTDTQSTFQRMVPIVQADAQKLGITFHVATVNGAYPTLETTSKNIAIAIFPGWFKDYADALTFFSPLFDGRTIIAQGNTNYSLVGMKPSQAKALGVTGTVTGIPSVDAQLDRCAALAGAATAHLLRGSRSNVDDEGRAVGAVPLAEQRPHHRLRRDAVAVRSVQQQHRVRARGGALVVRRPVALAKRARLLAVPAAPHRAPRPRMVARAVDEGPLAVGGPARLQALPRAVGHRLVHRDHDPPERCVGAVRCRRERRLAALEAQLDPRPARGGVEDAELGLGLDFEPRVREQQTPQRLAQLDGVLEIRGRRLDLTQLVCPEPRRERRGRGQLLDSVEEVPGVHEVPNELCSSHGNF